MGNILTDIMGYFKRKKFVSAPEDNDVVVVGVHESPVMTGVASPVPIKDAKLCLIKDLRDPCERANWPLLGIEAGIFLGKEIIDPLDPLQEQSCYYAFRRLKSLNLNLTIVENGDYVEFDTTAEENQAQNVGTGKGIYKDKTGEILNFRTLISSDDSLEIHDVQDEIDLKVPGGGIDVRQLDVTLTPAQLLSLNGGNTIELLPAPGANKMYYILNGLINLKFNSVVYDFSAAGLSDVVTLQLGTVSIFNDVGLNTANLNSPTDTFFIGDPLNPTGGQAPVNVPINLVSTSGISVSQGDSDLNFSLLYREINLTF